jgi:hypothetical protein
MNEDSQIKLDHIATHLENACKVILFSDDQLIARVNEATVDLETLRPDDFNDVPIWLKSDIERMINLIGDKPTQDNAIAFASKLLALYVQSELLRAQNGVKN